MTIAVLSCAEILPFTAAAVQAQEMGPLSQVDITEGLAEQSAQHVANCGAVPQQVQLQGFASQSGNGMPTQNHGQSQSQQSYGYGSFNQSQNSSLSMDMSQQNLSCSSSQNLSNQPGNENSGNTQCGQNYSNGGQNNQSFNNCQNNMQQNGSCYTGGGNGNNNSGSGFGINKQMVGVLGAALLVNYAVNGGVANVMGEMRARGYNNRFRGFGSSIGR